MLAHLKMTTYKADFGAKTGGSDLSDEQVGHFDNLQGHVILVLLSKKF